jgi:cathepsin E
MTMTLHQCTYEVINSDVDMFHRYRDETGAVLDKKTQLLRITPAQYVHLKPLIFTVGNRDFEFPANAQIWPRALNAFIGGDSDHLYLVVSDIGQIAAQGIPCICGYSFLERYYTVFDTTKKQVGFATTPFTTADSN